MDGALFVNEVSQLHLASTTDTVLIEVHGLLDDDTVRTIDLVAAVALDGKWSRVRVDLAHVVGFTEDGAMALGALQSRVRPSAGHRVVYQASSDIGQDALLAAYSRTA